MKKEEELRLVTRAQDGDHTAMEELYMMNKESIFRLAYRYVGNRQDAEDLLQEIFSKAFVAVTKKKYTPQAGAGFSTWLYRVGINCSISYLRKHKKFVVNHQQVEYERDDDYDPLDKADAPGPGPEHSAQMLEIREQVDAGLNNLSAKQRMIFILRFYEGLQVNEIAQYMKCSAGSVKKQLFRGVAKLRETLHAYKEVTP